MCGYPHHQAEGSKHTYERSQVGSAPSCCSALGTEVFVEVTLCVPVIFDFGTLFSLSCLLCRSASSLVVVAVNN